MNNSDLRQYSLMLETVRSIPQNVKDLGQVVNNLNSLVAALERPDPVWKQKFQTKWWALEEIYSYKISNAQEYLTNQERIWITNALVNISNLIGTK